MTPEGGADNPGAADGPFGGVTGVAGVGAGTTADGGAAVVCATTAIGCRAIAAMTSATSVRMV
ncbi:hypothetical protein D3C83_296920 [compost metagenome]